MHSNSGHNHGKNSASQNEIESRHLIRSALADSYTRDNLLFHQQAMDLSAYNTSRVILDAVGKDIIDCIVDEYIELLGTSFAIFEKNGDYVLGVFTSGWCKLLNEASLKLCGTDDMKEALKCRKWLCHESCWYNSALKCIEKEQPVEIECHGKLKIYSIPIIANDEVVGAINFGFGDIPRDPEVLKEIAEKYKVDINKLSKVSRQYRPHPSYLIDMAKKRLHTSARLIGLAVERKQTEDLLSASNKLLQETGRLAKVGGWSFDVATLNGTWTEEVYRIFELDSSVVPVLDACFLFFPPDVRPIVEQAVREAFETGKMYDLEIEAVTAKGNRRWIHMIGQGVRKDGKVCKIAGTIQDITDRTMAELANVQLQQQFQQMSDSMREVIFLVEPDWNKVIYVNAAHEQLWQQPVESVFESPRSWLDFILEEDREAIETLIDKPFVSGTEEIRFPDYRIRRPDGTIRWIRSHAIPVYDESGKLYRFAGIAEDITDSKHAHDELQKLTLQMEHRNQELEQLLHVTSHDLRSPLVNIQGFSGELKKTIDELEKILQTENIPSSAQSKLNYVCMDMSASIGFINSSTQKMEMLLKGLLDLFVVGTLEYTFKKCDMNRIVSAVVSGVAFKLQEQNITCTVDELPTCNTDEQQILHVFSNLIDNAIKYMSPERKGTLSVSGKVEGNEAIYAIADNGIGIKPEHHEKVFEIFCQLNPETSSGDGLGLSIVGRILKQINGRIWLESEWGKGTTFYLALPRD